MKMKLDDIDCVSAIIGTSLTNIKLFFHFSICPLFGSFALIYVYKWLLHLFALWQLLCELHELRVTWIALSCLGCIDDVGKIESCCCESQLVTLCMREILFNFNCFIRLICFQTLLKHPRPCLAKINKNLIVWAEAALGTTIVWPFLLVSPFISFVLIKPWLDFQPSGSDWWEIQKAPVLLSPVR